MDKIWIGHLSVAPWQDPAKWEAYFVHAQRIMGADLTHLDVSDPVRRKAVSPNDAGQFASAFEPASDSRWLFGKLGKAGVTFSIQHYRHVGLRANTLIWHVPSSFAGGPGDYQRLIALFEIGNALLDPFYSFSDALSEIAAKKKPTGAVDPQSELLGVFWLTYFNAAYVAFFGKDRLVSSPGVNIHSNGCATVQLGESPATVPSGLRQEVATSLGKEAFVDTKSVLIKPPGRFALTFQQLLLSQSTAAPRDWAN